MDSVLDEVRSVIGDVLDRGDGSWRALQEAGLLSLAAPKEHGGEGLGLAEVSVLLHEVGETGEIDALGDERHTSFPRDADQTVDRLRREIERQGDNRHSHVL